jgi:hypothetical protein
MFIECTITRPLAGGSGSQARGGPSPRLRPRLSLWESFWMHHFRKTPIFNSQFAEFLLTAG